MSHNALALAPVPRHQSVDGPVVYIIVPAPNHNNGLLLNALLEWRLLHNYGREASGRSEASDFLITSYTLPGHLVRALYPRCKDPSHRGTTAAIMIDISSSVHRCVVSAFNQDPQKDIVSAYQAQITQEAMWLYRSIRSLFRTAGHYDSHGYIKYGEDAVCQNIPDMKPSSNHKSNLAGHMLGIALTTNRYEVSINEITDLYYDQIKTQKSQHNHPRLMPDSHQTAAGGGGRRGGGGGGGSGGRRGGRRCGRGGGHTREDGGWGICKSLYILTQIRFEYGCPPGTEREFLTRLAQQASATFEKRVTHTYWVTSPGDRINIARRLDETVTDCCVNEWYTYVPCYPLADGKEDPASDILECAFNPNNPEGYSRTLTTVERNHRDAFRRMCERAASGLAARFIIPLHLTQFDPHRDVQTEQAKVAMLHLIAPVYCWNGAIVLEIVYDRVAAAVAAAAAAAAADAAAAAAAARAALMPRRAPSSGGRLSLQQLSLQPR